MLRVWDRAFADRSPCFDPLRPALGQLDCAHFPSRSELQRLVDGLAPRVSGRALRLVGAEAASAEPHERRVFRAGELVVRGESWHDLFNVLVWSTFPRAKAALNVRHVLEMERAPPGIRGSARDALTQLDEDGVVVLSSAPELLELIRAFQWRELFWRRRDAVLEQMRFLVFGHALYEKLLQPFVGITGKAVLLAVPAGIDDPVETADRRLAACIDAGAFASPRDLHPLPVLGIPGWYAGSAVEIFYDNAAYFRPGRQP